MSAIKLNDKLFVIKINCISLRSLFTNVLILLKLFVMPKINEYENLIIHLKSYCERGISLHSDDDFILSKYDTGFCAGQISAFEDILHFINKLDTGFYDDKISDVLEDILPF